MSKKKLIILISAAAALIVAAVTVTLILVLGGRDGDGDGGRTDFPESGVYYFDAKYDEYTLTLTGGNKFNLIVKGEFSFGSYALNNGNLTLDFDAEGKANVEAALQDDVVTMTYDNSSMRFIKKVNYSVTFDTNGGSSIPSAIVVNGKTAVKPDDPTRDGHLFVGWYADAEFKQPFSFESQNISADTVIYARWSEAGATATEYDVRFDLGYNGANAINPSKTHGNKVFDLPVPTREGYEFKGWWISMQNDPEKLSYECKDGTALDASTTLYALWAPTVANGTKLPDPIATVGAGSVSWSVVNGARSYSVTVTNNSGTVVFESDVSGTTANVPFDTYAPGEYTIRVTALANSGASNNSDCVRYFVNKALSRVSLFNVVEPATLNFNTVPNAEKYLITVVCGNSDHNHENFDNGLSRSFSFANCEMPADGIKFTVTAVADGYASSTSETFVYKRALPSVEGLRVDDATQTVLWNEVPDASYYMVSVNCGNTSHNHGFVSNGSKLSVSLKECAPTANGITVKVYPVTKGYISPLATEIKYSKTNLMTPSDIRICDLTLSWSVVAGADEYEVKVGNAIYKTESESFDLSDVIDLVEGTKYAISVRAIGSTESLWSDAVNAVYLDKPDGLSYAGNKLCWNPIIGAEYYEVQVNGGETVTVNGGATFSEITLDKAGTNVLKVRFVDGSDSSDWATLSVYAHTVTFDTRGGNYIDTPYVAVGDKITLPRPVKAGYEFVAWYSVPGGPVSNGRLYNDEIFSESGSIVLYAYYTAVEVNVTLSVGAEAGGDKITSGISYEEYYQLTVPTPLSPTMAFGGWYSAPYGMGNAYTDAKGNSLAPWNTLESIELHAFWIDYALEFTLTKVNGTDAYMVSAGERISMLEEVTVPSNFNGLPVAMVAGNAFKGCTTLKAINLPDTIAQISLVDPFSGCTALEAVNIYSTTRISSSRYWSEGGVLFDNGTGSVAEPKLLFMPLAKTGSYRIPQGIVEIPAGAFAGSALSRITVPASVTTIGTEAFARCMRLTSVTFEPASGAKALTIAPRAFLNCESLEKITLPARLSSISLTKYIATDSSPDLGNADNAFLGCVSLESINVAQGSSSYKSVDGILYSKDGKTLLYAPTTVSGKLSVPAGTQTVAPGAFIGCSGITEITVPNTVTAVGDYAFYGLKTNLSKVTFSGNGFNEVSIGSYAFRDCSNLAEIKLEAGSRISVINEGAFYRCAITEFKIPATVTKIGKLAFFGCTELEALSFAENGKTLAFEEDVFSGCSSLASVHIPANVSELPGIFNGCASLESITVDATSPYFESEDGVVFNKGKTEILFFPQGKTGVYTLPSTVTIIANGVFSSVSGVSKLVLPNTLTSIGDDAFSYSSIGEIVFTGTEYAEELHIGDRAFELTQALKTLVLPAHTKTLGTNAFYGSVIQNLTLNNGLESIGDYAFASTYFLYELTIPGSVKSIGDYCFNLSSIMDITLSDGVKEIGNYAFAELSYLNSITIPASVTKIGNYAFSTPNLSSVSFAPSSNLETIGAYAFHKAKIASVTIPKSVTAIGAYAFYYCTALESVTFEDGGSADLVIGTPYAYTHKDDYTGNMVTDILVGNVFKDATKLSSVVFPTRLVEIKERSFESAGTAAGSLTVSFGEGSRLTTIGDYCFYNSALTSIKIPASVRNLDPVVNDEFGTSYDRLGIGKYAFASSTANSSKLTSVTFELGTTHPLTVGKGAFEGAFNLTSLTLPKRLAPYTRLNGQTISGLEGGSAVFAGINGLTAVIIEDGGSHYNDVNGVVYTADLSELLFCPAGYVGAVSVPSSVTKINDRAFFNCVGVTEITFVDGNADMVIGNSAFAGCESITEISLPSNAVSLGEKAFSGCTQLESITLSEHINEFKSSMIENCPSLKNIEVEGNGGFFYDNGALYTADKTTLVLYTSNSTQATLTLLPTTVKILDGAFAGNTYLTTVILPSGLVEIGVNAFKGCTALSTLVIPNTVELICEGAFAGCVRLSAPEFEKGGTSPLIIGDLAFSVSGLRTLELPARASAIGNDVFAGSSLRDITFENGSQLSSIGNRVFEGTDVREIALPEGLVSIGDSTFEGTDVVRVTIPASLKTMGINTFRQCMSLEEVIFAQNAQLEALPAGTFAGSSITSVTIPASVISIQNKEYGSFTSNGVFEFCTSLTSVSFASNGRLTEIGQNAFQGCKSLREINIPASVSTVGYLAFYECTALTSVTIPQTTTSIGHSLFYGCTALENVVLESKTNELPTYMFYNCSSLRSITIPSNVTVIGEKCFEGTSLEEYIVAAGNTAYAARDGVLYKGDFSEILIYPSHKKSASITIPKELQSVGSDIFTGAASLKQVIFEEGGSQPLTIDAYAFQNCYQLHTVVFPERLKTIGSSAFENCYSLIKITIPAGVERIDEYAFRNCYKLVEVYNESSLNIKKGNSTNGYVGYYARNIYTPESGASIVSIDANGYVTVNIDGTATSLIGYTGAEANLTLPEGIDSIYQYAFYKNAGIESIIIPDGAGETSVGKSAFVGCGKPTLLFGSNAVPTSWGQLWNSDGCKVIVGCDGEEHTYSFVTNSSATAESITSDRAIKLPTLAPVSGKVFVGWCESSDLSGDIFVGSYYSSSDVTLYAMWVNEGDELPEISGSEGSSFDTAIELEAGQTRNVLIDSTGKKVYFVFTPTVSGIYHAFVSGSTESVLGVYTKPEGFADYSFYADFTNPVIDTNLRELTAGTTYYIAISLSSSDTAALSFTFTLWGSSGDEGGGDSGEDGNAGGSGFDDAIKLESGKESSALIENAGDTAYFTFTPTKTAEYNVYVYGSGAVLTVYGSDRTTVIDTVTVVTGNDANKNIELTADETYYITVSVNSAGFRTYVKVKEAAGSAGGNALPELDNPTQLEAGVAVNAQISAAGQKLGFFYTAAANGNHRVVVNSGTVYSALTLYDSDKRIIGYTEYGYSGTIEKTVSMTEGETYYVVVSLPMDAGNISLTLSAPKSDEPDGGEGGTGLTGGASFAEAVEIIPVTTYDLSCDEIGKKLYFKYTAPATGVYHVYVAGHSNAYMNVYKTADDTTPHQGIIQASWGTGLIDKDLNQLTEGETYYIVIGVSGYTADLEFVFSAPTEQSES